MNNEKQTPIIEDLSMLGLEVLTREPLAPYTSWKIGGPADYLVIATSVEQIKQVYALCVSRDIAFTVLGGGSDILISDEGIRGVVVINRAKEIEILDHTLSQDKLSKEESNQFSIWNDAMTQPKVEIKVESKVQHRHGEVGTDFYTFEDLDYEESGETKLVRFDSGVVVSYAIAWGLKNGFTGLQWFAGIPGTMGGALYNNIHGGTRHFSDTFIRATILDELGVREVDAEYFEFGYDQSVLRSGKNVVVLDVTIKMFSDSDVQKAKYVAQEWARRKRLQPRVSAGCIFQNIHSEDMKRLNFESPSVGYIIDKKLGWAGKKQGDAMISDKHAAFIENTGEAKAADVISLIREIKTEVKTRYNINLNLEINLLGFDDSTIAELRN